MNRISLTAVALSALLLSCADTSCAQGILYVKGFSGYALWIEGVVFPGDGSYRNESKFIGTVVGDCCYFVSEGFLLENGRQTNGWQDSEYDGWKFVLMTPSGVRDRPRWYSPTTLGAWKRTRWAALCHPGDPQGKLIESTDEKGKCISDLERENAKKGRGGR